MRIVFFIILFANLLLLLWQTQIVPEDQTDFPAVPESRRLLLLAEFKAQQTAKTVAADPSANNDDNLLPELPDFEITGMEDEEPTNRMSCYTVGPLKDLNRVKKLSSRISDLGASVRRRRKTEQEQYGYRVYLPPYDSREQALADAKRLADNGIHDYFIITDNDKQDGISLGLFRKKDGAIRRMAQVRRFDFTPQMEIRYRDTIIYWLDYEQQGQQVSEQAWREITEDSPGLQRLDRNCQLASADTE